MDILGNNFKQLVSHLRNIQFWFNLLMFMWSLLFQLLFIFFSHCTSYQLMMSVEKLITQKLSKELQVSLMIINEKCILLIIKYIGPPSMRLPIVNQRATYKFVFFAPRLLILPLFYVQTIAGFHLLSNILDFVVRFPSMKNIVLHCFSLSI